MWTLDHDLRLPLWRPVAAGGPLLRFTTRLGGVSAAPFDSLNVGRSTLDAPAAVDENRRRALAACGYAPGQLVTAGQVHGTRLVTVGSAAHVGSCDGLLTRTPGLVLAVTVADCMPLILVAPGAVAVVHAGWRGAAEGLPGAALRTLCEAAACDPGAVVVHLGPCIRACCYRVGAEVSSRFPAAVASVRAGATHLDLAAAARLQLAEAGLPPGSFVDTGECTACHADRYFSHRRDGERTGRQWALAALSQGLPGARSTQNISRV